MPLERALAEKTDQRNGFCELERYLDSANVFIGMAEDDLNGGIPTTEEEEPSHSHPSTMRHVLNLSNSAVRRSEKNHDRGKPAERTLSLEALLESLRSDSPPAVKNSDHVLEISQIEDMTRQLLNDLEDIQDGKPLAGGITEASQVSPRIRTGATAVSGGTECQTLSTNGNGSITRHPQPFQHWAQLDSSNLSSSPFCSCEQTESDASIASPGWEFGRLYHPPPVRSAKADGSSICIGQRNDEIHSGSLQKMSKKEARECRAAGDSKGEQVDSTNNKRKSGQKPGRSDQMYEVCVPEIATQFLDHPSLQTSNHPILVNYRSALKKSSDAFKSNRVSPGIRVSSTELREEAELGRSESLQSSYIDENFPQSSGNESVLDFFESTSGIHLIGEFEEQFLRLTGAKRSGDRTKFVCGVAYDNDVPEDISCISERESVNAQSRNRGAITAVTGDKTRAGIRSISGKRGFQRNSTIIDGASQEACESSRSVAYDQSSLPSPISGLTLSADSASDTMTATLEAGAVQAIEWLRQTGFPQYVQMYEDNAFPLDMMIVYRDHPQLDKDEIQSLVRRLSALNRCVKMSNEPILRSHSSDEDLALSDNWRFHRPSRRWSRIEAPGDDPLRTPQIGLLADGGSSGTSTTHDEEFSTRDSVFAGAGTQLVATPSPWPGGDVTYGSLPSRCFTTCATHPLSIRRILDGRNSTTSPAEDADPIPPYRFRILGKGNSANQENLRRTGSERFKDVIVRKVDSLRSMRSRSLKISQTGKMAKNPTIVSQSSQHISSSGDTKSPEFSSGTVRLNAEGNKGDRQDQRFGESPRKINLSSTAPEPSSANWHCFVLEPEWRVCLSSEIPTHSGAMTACNSTILQKHALLRLTALMERYSPTFRSGWVRSMPKFFRKITTPNYRDKITFGVPLSSHIQRTGHPTPPSIQTCLRFLSSIAPNCPGIFRKSGVRSRIEKLRQLHELHIMDAHLISYDTNQCHDVADMVKQYFRELPEGGLLSAKFVQTFLYIFIHIPEEHRFEALQAAILVLPDENREVLETLLVFLDDVSQSADRNGMTVSNLALCFAPSIFQLTQSQRPKRKRNDSWLGDREIRENRAAKACLSKMIEWHQQLFLVSAQTLQTIRLVDVQPAELAPFLRSDSRYSFENFMRNSIRGLIQEIKSNRGWTQVSHPEMDLAFKRIDDEFHQIRLWKCSTLVEAPPSEVLTRILRDRHSWDNFLTELRVLRKVDRNTDVCYIVRSEMYLQAQREYLLLRNWKTDILPNGTCALIQFSINDHGWESSTPNSFEKGELEKSRVRALVLSSRYLVQPGGAGKSKLIHLIREDFRGRGGKWYNRSSGFIHALDLKKIAQSFTPVVSGHNSFAISSTTTLDKETRL